MHRFRVSFETGGDMVINADSVRKGQRIGPNAEQYHLFFANDKVLVSIASEYVLDIMEES